MSDFKPGQKVICVETSIVEYPGYLSDEKKVVVHKDMILSESSIRRSVGRAKTETDKTRIFVPQLEIHKVMVSESGKIYLSFINGRNTPLKYCLYHIHPVERFRKVREGEAR